jgi:hypothetical protein
MVQSYVAGEHLGVQTKRQESARPSRNDFDLGTAGTSAALTRRKASGKNCYFVEALPLAEAG